MTYISRIIGIRILRFLIALGVKIVKPNQSLTPDPKPVRTIHIPSSFGKQDSPSPSAKDVEAKEQRSKRSIRCDIYLPSTSNTNSSSSNKDTTLPVVVNLHGSGFCIYAMQDDAIFCQTLADQVPCIVIDVDYSKAPERSFPAANVDVDAVLNWLWQGQKDESVSTSTISHQDAFRAPNGGTPFKPSKDRVALTGFSSGGNLALTACVRTHKGRENNGQKGNGGQGSVESTSPFAAVIAFYPSTNLSESPWKKPQLKPEKGAAGGVLPPRIRAFFYNCYLPGNDPMVPKRSSSLISPLYGDAAMFPESVTVITCGRDSLAREGRQFAEHIVAGRTSSEQRTEYAQQDAENKVVKCDPPADVTDVDRVAIPHNIERQGVLWWEAPGQGHAWDKMVKSNTDPERLRSEAYKISVDRLQKAFAHS